MAVNGFTNMVTDGLVLCLDAANLKSYPTTGTTWVDLSRVGNNGILTNGPTFSSTNGGNIVFDGVDDYVSLPEQNVLVNKTQVSMCAWMKRTLSNSMLSIGQIESYSNDFSFELWSDGFAYFEVGNGQNSYGRVSNNSTSWQFVSMVYNGSLSGNSNKLRAYINETEQILDYAGTTIPSTTGTLNNSFIVGSFLPVSLPAIYGNGSIATIQIYSRAITTQEVLQNYNATKWRFI